MPAFLTMAARDVLKFEIGHLEVLASAAQPPGFSQYEDRRQVLLATIVELVKLHETWDEARHDFTGDPERIDADHLQLTLQAIGARIADASPPFDPRDVFLYLMRHGSDHVPVAELAADLELVEAEIVRHLREGHVPGWALVVGGDLRPYAAREF